MPADRRSSGNANVRMQQAIQSADTATEIWRCARGSWLIHDEHPGHWSQREGIGPSEQRVKISTGSPFKPAA
jgi:hypothetical protein